MKHTKKPNKDDFKKRLPDPEELANELANAKSIDDFYGKDGIFARLFSETVEQMLEAELTEELGYCIIRGKPSTNSGTCRPAIPEQAVH